MSGGHLASVHDGFVNAFIAQGGVEAFQIMEVESFWVGGHDLHNQATVSSLKSFWNLLVFFKLQKAH
jgi:hypothetical protein